MRESKTKPAWVKKLDAHWALAYLDGWSRRHPGQPSGAVLYDRLCQMGTLKEDKSIHPELARKMKAAWASRKFRNKKDELRHCSFALSMDAARQLDKLARGGTKIGTLETIILDRAKQEIAYKSARRDEGVYKQRAQMLEKHLDQAFEELYTYRFLLTEAGIDPSGKAQHQSEIPRLIRQRKKELLTVLPALSSKGAPRDITRTGRPRPTTQDTKPNTPSSPHMGVAMPQLHQEKDAHPIRTEELQDSLKQAQESSAIDINNHIDSERFAFPVIEGVPGNQRSTEPPSNALSEDNRPNWQKIRERLGPRDRSRKKQ